MTEVYPYVCADGTLGLFSDDNGRPIAFSMLQATHCNETLKVHCVVNDTHGSHCWWDGYSTTTNSLSIGPSRYGVASHGGVELFNDFQRTMSTLDQALHRHQRSPGLRRGISMLLRRGRQRSSSTVPNSSDIHKQFYGAGQDQEQKQRSLPKTVNDEHPSYANS